MATWLKAKFFILMFCVTFIFPAEAEIQPRPIVEGYAISVWIFPSEIGAGKFLCETYNYKFHHNEYPAPGLTDIATISHPLIKASHGKLIQTSITSSPALNLTPAVMSPSGNC